MSQVTEILLRTRAQSRQLPWKNGRGTTEELAIWPEATELARGDFDWRISKAVVAESGPFSSFPGFDRTLVPTGGDGLELRHGAASAPVLVRPFSVHRFSGDVATSAVLLGSPVPDFNVIVRRGYGSADVAVHRASGAVLGIRTRGEHAFLHVLAAAFTLRVGGEAPVTVAPGESLWLRGLIAPLDLAAECATADGVLLFVRIAASEQP